MKTEINTEGLPESLAEELRRDLNEEEECDYEIEEGKN